MLLAARAAGYRALPFKPAVSGPEGAHSDPERLRAAAEPDLSLEEISPLRYEQPLAPGVAEDPTPFLRPSTARRSPESDALLTRMARHLEGLEHTHRPSLTLIEGAGGLHVPMPAGTWQLEWIQALEARPLIVARAGLGTLNHTLLTIESLRSHDLEPAGFIFVDQTPETDPSRTHNAAIVTARSGLPCLGLLPHAPSDGATPRDPLPEPTVTPWHDPSLWQHLGLS
jgi:dethiobiotin synthetase